MFASGDFNNLADTAVHLLKVGAALGVVAIICVVIFVVWATRRLHCRDWGAEWDDLP